jgi:hypothetical protein
MLGHRQPELAADGRLGSRQKIEGLGDDALCGVLEGQHAESRLASLHRIEDLLEGGHRTRFGLGAELLPHRQVREGPLGPQKGDGEALLQCAGRGDDLAKDGAECIARERARVPGRQTLDDVALPCSAIHEEASFPLDATHLLAQARTRVQAVEDLPIHRVDRVAQVV